MKKRDFFHSAGMTVAIMIAATLLSKALGLVRQMMMAAVFAASVEGIAFSAASRIPLAIFDMLFSTAILGSFLPIYKGGLETDAARAKRFSSSFLSAILAVTAAVSLVGVLFSDGLIGMLAPELAPETKALAALLLRIMFPSVIFAGAAYTLVGVLQSHERFLLPAIVSAVSNLIMIVYLASRETPVGRGDAIGLAVAYLISWMAQFFTLAVPLFRERKFPLLTRRLKNSDVALAFRRSLPVMFSSWLIPVTTLTAGAFSSLIASESIEADAASGAAIVVYENAFSVFSIAAGLIVYGVCNYIFPKLSARAAGADRSGFAELMRGGLLISFSMILPLAVFLFLMSGEIVSLLYMRGDFTAGLAHAAGESLRMLTLAMPAYALWELFSRVCYSAGRVRLPMLSSIVGIGAMLAAFFAFWLTETLNVSTVALASAVGQIVSALVLCVASFCIFSDGNQMFSFRKTALLLLGSTVSGLAMWGSKAILMQFLNFSNTFQNFIAIAIVFAVGFMVYLIWLIMTKIITASIFHP